jgi:hypothetical protein
LLYGACGRRLNRFEEDRMQLSATQFLRILETLRSDPLQGRRRTPRVGLRVKATMVPCVESGPVAKHEVWVRDLSVEGVGFVHSVPLPPDSFVILQFASKNDPGLSVLYQVTRSHQLAAMSVEIGAKIDHVLSAEELVSS